MESKVAIRKIAKNGNSRTVTVTDEANSLKLVPGDRVVLAIARDSPENEAIFDTIGLIGSEEVRMLPMKFIGPESPAYKHVFPDDLITVTSEKDEVEDLELLLKQTTSILKTFIEDASKELQTLVVDSGSSIAYRSFVPEAYRIHSTERKIKTNYVMLSFLEELIRNSNLNQSPLIVTSELYRAINEVLDVYDDVITAPPEKAKAIIQEQNKDYINRIEAIGKLEDRYLGFYIVVKGDGDDMESVEEPGFCPIISNSTKAAESYIKRRIEERSKKLEPDVHIEHIVLGPMSAENLAEFEPYLSASMKVQNMNKSRREVLVWAKKLFEEYIGTLKPDRKYHGR